MATKMETNYNNDIEINETPKSPKYSVGRIVIHSDDEVEIEGEEWLSRVQVAPPPRSPIYMTYNEIEEDQTSNEQNSIGTSSDENEKEEHNKNIVRWHGRLNLNIINPATTIQGETLQTHGLKNIKTKVRTIANWENGFQIHQLRPAEPTIWIPKSFGTIAILTGPLGVITSAQVQTISNITSSRRTDKAVIHLTNFSDSKSEDGMEVPELNCFEGRLILEASGNKWKTLIGRRVRTYLRPTDTEGIYTRITGLKECINQWYTNKERSPPLINCKIISVQYSRHDQRRTSYKTPAAATDEVSAQRRWTNYQL